MERYQQRVAKRYQQINVHCCKMLVIPNTSRDQELAAGLWDNLRACALCLCLWLRLLCAFMSSSSEYGSICWLPRSYALVYGNPLIIYKRDSMLAWGLIGSGKGTGSG